MIIDSFIFFNELDLLEGRLEYLYDHVDFFILVEADITFSGNPKPYYFRDNMSRYKKYLDKVIYSPYKFKNKERFNFSYRPDQLDFSAPQWNVEREQRNQLISAAEIFDDESLLLISDVDEIPRRDSLPLAKDLINHKDNNAIAYIQDFFYYNFRKRITPPWLGSVILSNSYAQKNKGIDVRAIRGPMPKFTNAGWHLSYWYDIKGIQTKLQSFSHQELNIPKYLDENHIKNCVTNNIDLFGRGVEFEEFDPNTLDPEFYNIFKKFTVDI